MELRHLRYFVAVAEELNFTRAADRLHMAQPPLSTQIRALEDELGADLFVRDKRKVYLTQAGEEFLARARAILDAARDARVAAKNAALGIIGRVRLAYTASAMFSERLPAVIREFRLQHSNVQLTLVESTSLDQISALYDRQLDVGVLRKPDVPLPDGIVIEAWHQTRLIAAIPAGHPLAQQASISIADLRDQPIITYPRDAGIGLYWPFLQLCARAGFQPQIVSEARESPVIIGLVAAGVGIAVVPAATQCIHIAEVVYVQIDDREAVSTLYLAFRVDDETSQTGKMLRILRERS